MAIGVSKRIDFALEVACAKARASSSSSSHSSKRMPCLRNSGSKQVVPAAVLGGDEAVDFGGEGGQRLVGAQAVVALFAVAVFNALHEAGLADFDVFVEIGAGDG